MKSPALNCEERSDKAALESINFALGAERSALSLPSFLRRFAPRNDELALVALAAITLALVAAPALAQTSPFSPRSPAPGGPVGYILEQQQLFYRQLASAVRALRQGDGAAWSTLLGLSFLYGVFHAAGPGHGKAVISSYIVSTSETIRRGLWLSTAAALTQAVVAVALVAIFSLVIGATARTMTAATTWIEIIAYALVALLGARLVWTKGRAFLARLASWRTGRPVASMACDDGCVHLPLAEQAARTHDWRETVSIVLAVGLRPCTGAVLVLVFALAQGVLEAGVAATFAMAAGTAITVGLLAMIAAGAKGWAVRLADARTGLATLSLSAAELLAALVVLVFGLGLLTGTIVLERAAPF